MPGKGILLNFESFISTLTFSTNVSSKTFDDEKFLGLVLH